MEQVRRMALIAVATGALLAALGSPAGALACMHCTAFNDCAIGGFTLMCSSGKFLGIPFCVQFGSCGFSSGDDDMPGLKRPVLPLPRGATPAADERPAPGVGASTVIASTELSLYLLAVPLRDGLEPFEPGVPSWVERGVSEPRTPGAMLAPVARRGGRLVERLEVSEESVSIGPGSYQNALADPSGDGYVIRALAVAGGVRVRLCALRGRSLAGTLADVTLASDDVLCVRIHANGLDQALTLAAQALTDDQVEAIDAAQAARARFHAVAGPLTARATPFGMPLMPVAVPADACP